MGGIVNWRFILVLVIVLPCLAVQAHYFPKHRHLHHPKHHGHKPGAGRSLLTQADAPIYAPTYDDKHKHEHHHEHHHDHDHKHDHDHDHDHKHHPFYAPSYAPAHHPEHHPKHHHPTHGPVYAPTHQPVHHQDHKHDHDHDHKHHPKHLLLFAHEIKKNISGVQWGNKSKEEEFDRIRTVSAVLKEGKFNESKIVGSQLGIVVVGKEHIYTSFSYFLHGHGTIAVQGFIHGGKAKEDEKDEDGKDKEDWRAKEERVLAVVGGTGDFLSVTGVDRSVFHHEKDVDVDVHRLTLDYPKHWD